MRKKIGSLLLCLSLLTGRTLGKEKPKVDEQQKSSVSLQYVKDGVCNPRTFFEFLLACGLGYSYLNKGKSKKSFDSLNINNQSLNFNGTKPKKDNNIINKNINLKFDGIESKKSFGNLDIGNQSLNFIKVKPEKKDGFDIKKEVDFKFDGVKPDMASAKSFGNLDISNQGLNFIKVKPEKKDGFDIKKEVDFKFDGVKPDMASANCYRVMNLDSIFYDEISKRGWEETEKRDDVSFCISNNRNLTALFRCRYEYNKTDDNEGFWFNDEAIVGGARVSINKPESFASFYFGENNFVLVSRWKKLFCEKDGVYLILEEYKSKNGSNARGENVKDMVWVVGYLANIKCRS